MNFKYTYDQYTGLYSGITRPPFPENSTDIEPYFNFACKTVWDFQKNQWKLVERFSFYEQFKDIDRVNELDLQFIKKIDELEKILDLYCTEISKQAAGNYLKIDVTNMKNHESITDQIKFTNNLISALKHDNDMLCHLQQNEMNFIKSQLHYLTTIIERPSFFQRLLKLILFWQ